MPTPGLIAFDHLSWSDNGERIVYEAQTQQGRWNVYTQRVVSGPPVLITQARDSYPVLSPDGKTVALHEERGGISLYSADGGQPSPLKGASDSELAMRFLADGKSLLVGDATGLELALTRIDLASGHRDPWKSFPTETRSNQLFATTPDLKYYAYAFSRFSSSLYVVNNLR